MEEWVLTVNNDFLQKFIYIDEKEYSKQSYLESKCNFVLSESPQVNSLVVIDIIRGNKMNRNERHKDKGEYTYNREG